MHKLESSNSMKGGEVMVEKEARRECLLFLIPGLLINCIILKLMFVFGLDKLSTGWFQFVITYGVTTMIFAFIALIISVLRLWHKVHEVAVKYLA